MIRLSITVLKNFVKKCFLKKYAEGYKSEVATKALFYRISHLGFNWNTSILIECSTNTIIYIRKTFRV